MDIISPISLRFHNSLLETSFYSAHNAQLHAYDVACSLALPLIPLAVVARRCYALLPTSICRLFGHCRHPQSCPVPVPFAARPVINTALLAHAVVYLTLITTLLFASRAWLAHRRVLIACAMRMWYTCILPVIVCLQPRGKSGGEYTCTYLQGLHLHTVLLTTAIVPLCHQVRTCVRACMHGLHMVATAPTYSAAVGTVFNAHTTDNTGADCGGSGNRALYRHRPWVGFPGDKGKRASQPPWGSRLPHTADDGDLDGKDGWFCHQPCQPRGRWSAWAQGTVERQGIRVDT